MSRCRSLAVAALAASAAAAGGCHTPDGYVSQADSEVSGMLDKVQAEVLGDRVDDVRPPAPAAPPAPEPPPGPIPPPGEGIETIAQEEKTAGRATEADLTAPLDSASPDAVRLDLHTSLRLSVTSGRDYQNQKESLYLAGLSLSLTRYNFGPLLNGTVSYLWSDAEKASSSGTLAATLGLSQILPSGGTLAADGLVSASHQGAQDEDDPLFDSHVGVDLTQPLLRGSGYLVSHEALTQGERNLVYAVRDFELFREQYAIDIARDYYDLVSRRKRIANLEQSWRDAVFDRNKSEALRQVGRNEDQDVFGARRREIDAENTLIEARTDYKLALDDFKIALGLTTSTEVVVVDEEPPYRPVALDETSAVEVAQHNRLDLVTARERLEDVERSVDIAEDGLQPDLDLALSHGFSGNNPVLSQAVPDSSQTTAALTLELPLNRQAERNAYRSSLVALDRARRDLQLTYDDVERDVRSQLRELRQIEQQTELQKDQIGQEQRAVAVMEIRYASGDVDSRDLLDARQSLVDAQNDLIDLQARHVIARLVLMRTLGVLFLGDDGMWIE